MISNESQSEMGGLHHHKRKVGIADVLMHYGLLNDLKERKNHELVGYCPIHDEAQYNKNAFCANAAKNNWHCFACGEGGNVLDFVAQMEDVNIRQAGLLIQEWFGLSPALGRSDAEPLIS